MGGRKGQGLALLAARACGLATSGHSASIIRAAEEGSQPGARALATLHSSTTASQQPSITGRTPANTQLTAASPSGARHIHTSTALDAAADYYEVLGLDRTATEQDIKKAYYQLAKKFHPDTNKDNANAAARFQEVSKAYETLRDPEKRRMYDQVGREGMDRMESGGGAGPGPEEGFPGFGGFSGFPGFSANDIFEHFFRADPRINALLFSRIQMPPITISFMEAVQGTRKTLPLGLRPGATQVQTIEITIPPGVDTGDMVETQVDLGGAGRGTRKAMLTIPIEVLPHPKFRREGANICTTLDLPLTKAILGTTTRTETLDGAVELIVPPLTRQGDRLRVRNKGIMDPRRGLRGDHYVEMQVTMPSSLNQRQRELLKEFEVEEEGKKASGSGRR